MCACAVRCARALFDALTSFAPALSSYASLPRRHVLNIPVLPSRAHLGFCVVCASNGQPHHLLDSKEGGLIPIWTLSGVATKTKPVIFCHYCGYEERLGPAGASKLLNAVTTACRAQTLFARDLVDDLCVRPLVDACVAWRMRGWMQTAERMYAARTIPSVHPPRARSGKPDLIDARACL